MEIMDLATGRQLLQRQDGDSVNSENDRGSGVSSTTSTTVVGPYVEGSDVRVRCRVYGGKSDTTHPIKRILNYIYSFYSGVLQ